MESVNDGEVTRKVLCTASSESLQAKFYATRRIPCERDDVWTDLDSSVPQLYALFHLFDAVWTQVNTRLIHCTH